MVEALCLEPSLPKTQTYLQGNVFKDGEVFIHQLIRAPLGPTAAKQNLDASHRRKCSVHGFT